MRHSIEGEVLSLPILLLSWNKAIICVPCVLYLRISHSQILYCDCFTCVSSFAFHVGSHPHGGIHGCFSDEFLNLFSQT